MIDVVEQIEAPPVDLVVALKPVIAYGRGLFDQDPERNPWQVYESCKGMLPAMNPSQYEQAVSLIVGALKI